MRKLSGMAMNSMFVTTTIIGPKYPVYTFLLESSQRAKEFVDGMLCMLVRPKTFQPGFPLMKIGWRQCVLGRLTSMHGLCRMRKPGNRSSNL